MGKLRYPLSYWALSLLELSGSISFIALILVFIGPSNLDNNLQLSLMCLTLALFMTFMTTGIAIHDTHKELRDARITRSDFFGFAISMYFILIGIGFFIGHFSPKFITTVAIANGVCFLSVALFFAFWVNPHQMRERQRLYKEEQDEFK